MEPHKQTENFIEQFIKNEENFVNKQRIDLFIGHEKILIGGIILLLAGLGVAGALFLFSRVQINSSEAVASVTGTPLQFNLNGSSQNPTLQNQVMGTNAGPNVQGPQKPHSTSSGSTTPTPTLKLTNTPTPAPTSAPAPTATNTPVQSNPTPTEITPTQITPAPTSTESATPTPN